MVDSCETVHFPLRCNLTEVFSNLNDLYYVNVSAVLGNETSTPRSYPAFKPVSDSKYGHKLKLDLTEFMQLLNAHKHNGLHSCAWSYI